MRCDKLVFIASRPKLSVIANQSADWCGNPPVRGEMYRQLPYGAGNLAVFGGNRNLVPLNRGIATPVCALARNDSIFSNTNLSFFFIPKRFLGYYLISHIFYLLSIHMRRPCRGSGRGGWNQYWVGVMCQISSAYWRMVRSEENLAPEAMFIRHLRPKFKRSP